MPNYPSRRIDPAYRGALWRTERRGDVAVHRSWLRVRPNETVRDKALYEATFTAASLPRMARRFSRSDVLVCVVPSLGSAVVAAGAIRLARAVKFERAPRFVLWVQDLVLVAASSVEGVGTRAARVFRAFRGAEFAAVRAADRVVVCSPGFSDYFVAGGVDVDRIDVIPNWVDVDWIEPRRAAGNGASTRFLYAGNLGYTQGFETLVDASRLSGPDVEVRIVGDGNARARVHVLAVDLAHVSVEEPVAQDDFPSLLAAADVHVVVQRKVSAGANLPSKIASYLASGRPIVAAIDPSTPAAALLTASGGAMLVPPESPAELARVMTLLHERPDVRAELGQKGRAFAERELAREVVLPRLEQAFLG